MTAPFQYFGFDGVFKIKILQNSNKGYKMKKTLLSILAFGALANAGSVGGFGGSTEWTQIANNLQLADQSSRQIQQYYTQIQQYTTQIEQFKNQAQSYEMMLKNLGNIPQAQWDNFSNQVQYMKNVQQNTQGMGFVSSSYLDKFKDTYKDFDGYLAQNNTDPSQTYKDISKQMNQTVSDSLKQLNLQQKDIETDEQVMKELGNLSKTADGQKAAVQAANEIALHQTHQLKKMQQTMMQQVNLQNQYMAAEQATKDQSGAYSSKMRDKQITTKSNSNQMSKKIQ